jgi:hypothetical protein
MLVMSHARNMSGKKSNAEGILPIYRSYYHDSLTFIQVVFAGGSAADYAENVDDANVATARNGFVLLDEPSNLTELRIRNMHQAFRR